MRKIYFSIVAGALIFAACKKDSNNPADLVGTWIVNSITGQSYLNGTLEEADTATAGSLTFESNGNVSETDEDGIVTTGTYTYDASSKNLNLISDGDTTNLTVTTLTSSNLHLHEDETSTAAGLTYRFVVDADYHR